MWILIGIMASFVLGYFYLMFHSWYAELERKDAYETKKMIERCDKERADIERRDEYERKLAIEKHDKYREELHKKMQPIPMTVNTSVSIIDATNKAVQAGESI